MATDAVTRAALRLREAQRVAKDGNYERVWPTYADRFDIEKLVEFVLDPEEKEKIVSPHPPRSAPAPWRPGAGPRAENEPITDKVIDYSNYPPGHTPGTPM